jgi:hypothetical protein
MVRDIAIASMVNIAADRWKLPRLNSSGDRHSAAWFTAVVMTEHGHKLAEQQVRRICKAYAKGFAKRTAAFFIAAQSRTRPFEIFSKGS